jgi:hypothetical protein
LAPLRYGLSRILAFKTPRDASEVCRIANFCTQHVELRGVEAYEIDGGGSYLSVVIMSHEELADTGWCNYGLDMCILPFSVPPQQECAAKIVWSLDCYAEGKLSSLRQHVATMHRRI